MGWGSGVQLGFYLPSPTPVVKVRGKTSPKRISGRAKFPWAMPLNLVQGPLGYIAGPWRRGQVGPRKPWGWRHQSSQSPQGGGSNSSHSKRPRYPGSPSPSNSWPPQSPWSLEELGEGREQGQAEGPQGCLCRCCCVLVPETCYLPPPPGSHLLLGTRLHPFRYTQVLLNKCPHTGSYDSPPPWYPFPQHLVELGKGG